MGAIKNRKEAFKRINKLLEDPAKVLIIHYSQAKTYDEDYAVISPIISAIVVKSLSGELEKHFALYYEADKANIPIEEIENSYRDLELRNLRSFNEFARRRKDYLWVHWEMRNIHFGFEAIKHRYEKIFYDLKEEKQYEVIPENKKLNLCKMLEDIYGTKFAENPDKLASLMKTNNNQVLDNNYLTLDREEKEFENKNHLSIINSLDCKVDFLRKALKLLSKKELKVLNKNRYARFVDTVNHPIFTFIGWVATISGLGVAIYSLLTMK